MVVIKFSVTLTPVCNLFSLIISSCFLFLTPLISRLFNSGKSISFISKSTTLSNCLILNTSTELKRFDSHNFFIAELIFSPGIEILSPSLSPE